MRTTITVAGLCLSMCAGTAVAQTGHEHHAPAPPSPSPSPAPSPDASPAGHHAAAATDPPMLFDSDMARMAGMTPQPGHASFASGWQWMFLALGRLTFNDQAGPSGEEALESQNWGMAMAQRSLGRGQLTLMAMGSLEPATVPAAGSPQLFQVGETYEGRLIVDRQHPHDLFMNLSATYRRPLGARGALWVQAAPVGEPALGPTAFMHRASAGENPSSTLGHHWQDSTHITYNVLTAGVGWRWLSVEGSTFHGREPDEQRWDIDGGKPDSVSGRLRLDLPDGWSAQVSHGYLEEPEALEPGDLRRTTASLHYGARGDRPLAASFGWGRNREQHGVTDAYLLEMAWQMTARDQFYARAEQVHREPALLLSKGFDIDRFGHAHGPTDATGERQEVGVQALTLGYARGLRLWSTLHAALGADLTVYRFPVFLQSTYGDAPVSAHAFLRLRWTRGEHGASGHH
jgi:hypothetical protein